MPYKVHKLVLLRGERRAVSVYPCSAAGIGGLQPLTVFCRGVPPSNKVYVVYEAKPQCAIIRALEFL